MLIPGTKLNAEQRKQVLARFVHRWTFENAEQNYGGRCPACVQQEQSGAAMTINQNGDLINWHEYHVKLETDEQWLARYAFHFVKDGSRLMHNRMHAEPI